MRARRVSKLTIFTIPLTVNICLSLVLTLAATAQQPADKPKLNEDLAKLLGREDLPTSDGPETIYELFRILDNFNVPIGAAEGSDDAEGMSSERSATIWTTAHDMRNKVFNLHILSRFV